MARILSLEEVSHKMRSSISSALRMCDEVTILPQAARSPESGAFKNVVMRLVGNEPGLSPDIFSSNWYSGVSILPVPEEVAARVLKDTQTRLSYLKKLTDAIPSEMADPDLQVGPPLDGDLNGCDTAGWTAGLDGPACCVGLYSARRKVSSDPSTPGLDRHTMAYFLVCKAGAGLAAQTFHSRLTSAMRNGATLESALETGEPGSSALLRVADAGQRNRARILRMAAEAIGFHSVDTVSDHTAFPGIKQERCAVTCASCNYNTIRRVESQEGTVFEYSAGCVNTTLNTGIVVCSNVMDGFVLFSRSNGDFKLSVRNEAHNHIPFCTERLLTSREVSERVTKTHPDESYIRSVFSWKNRAGLEHVNAIPSSFWGSHATQRFTSHWARELGLQDQRAEALVPELVVVSALEPAKLRALARHFK